MSRLSAVKTRQLYALRVYRARAEIGNCQAHLESIRHKLDHQWRHVEPLVDLIRAEGTWRIKLRQAYDALAVLLNSMNERPCKQHIIQFSGGIGSFFAAKRVVEKYGADNTTLLFADTKMEDPDLYRFIDDASKHLGVPLTILCDGRTPWDVFRDKQFLGNTRVDPCSLVLKRELLWGWIERNAPKDAVVYVGIDWSEEHRLERLREYRKEWKIESPLLWPPMPEKPAMLKALKKLGIEIPALYKLNFAHNNCGGFCVKSGQAQFRLLLETMPERYAFHEKKEQELRQFLEKDVAILRDRRGGKTRPMTLEEFRKRIEAGGEHERYDYGGCGCAIE